MSVGAFFWRAANNFGARNALVKHESAIEHRRFASTVSRRSVDAKLEGIYIVVDAERKTPPRAAKTSPPDEQWLQAK